MKLHDTILCASHAEVRQLLHDLSLAGFHAVAGGGNGLTITITGVPDTEWLVQAREGGATQKVYCVTREEAEDIYEELCRGYVFVEMLEGYAGEWQSIAQTW